jgi:hypothetical protein
MLRTEAVVCTPEWYHYGLGSQPTGIYIYHKIISLADEIAAANVSLTTLLYLYIVAVDVFVMNVFFM